MLRATARLRAASGSPLTPGPGPYQVFDRKAKALQKQRAVLRQNGERSRTVDYLRDEAADRLMERFWDIKRNFGTILDFGSGSGHFSRLLTPDKVQKSILYDSSALTLNRDQPDQFQVATSRIHADEERLLETVGEQSYDAIVSCLTMHWVNDLPGVLTQIQRALKPDGLFLGCMLGGETLFELRTALQLAQLEREGGISPHVSPMTDTRDVSNLLGRAGFTLLTVDIDEVKVNYPSMWELVEDLRDMGESNAILGRRPFLHRDTLAAASAIYKAMHGENGEEGESVPATFQIIYMIGWKPGPEQRQPLERGTGEVNLKDVLET
ncbi:S-adenosyl-L-methionine-dependent methyltransferase, partial [Flagelloscypha sp. PMI_526]